MNILYMVHPSEKDTATYAHTVEVIANLRKLGHTVNTLQVSRSPAHSAPSAQSKPLWVRVLSHTPVKWLYRRLKGELALLYLVWVELGLTVRLLRHRGAHNVLYSRHRWLNGAELLCSRLWKIPYTREVNGLVADEMRVRKAGSRPSIWLFDRIEHWGLRKGHQWAVISWKLKETLTKEYRVPEERITIVPNGANTELFRPMDKAECRKALGLPKGEHIVCFVGQMWEAQGLQLLLRATQRLPEVRLLLVGGNPEGTGLEELATRLSIKHRVHFTGRIPQSAVPTHIGASDVCAAPFVRERNERMGLSALKVHEYAACGRPIVASETPGLEFVREEGAGILTPPDDEAALAHAIKTLLENPELRGTMGGRAREYAVREGNWGRVAERVAEVLEESRKPRTEEKV